jgi:hemoglobin
MSPLLLSDDEVSNVSLYVRVGGQPAVQAAVDGLYDRILADPDLAPYFAASDVRRLKTHQRAFITMALGGPTHYAGRPLQDAHHRLDISEYAFAKVVGHLADTLVALDVDPAVIAAIAEALRPLEAQIVATHA